MQRIRRGIEADIARDHLFGGQRVESLSVGKLVDIVSRMEQAQQIGLVFGHVGSVTG